MTVISRYIRREVYTATGLVVLALLGLFALFDLIGELDQLGESGYRLRDMFVFVALNLPGHLYQVLPVAALIGTTFALTHLAQQSEYAVMRASGVSAAQLALVLARAGLVIALVGAAIGEWVAPEAERSAQALRLQAKSALIAQEFRSGLWVKDENSFINVREVAPDSRLLGLKVYEFDQRWVLQRIWLAAVGEYEGDSQWRLTDIVETRFTGEGTTVGRQPETRWRSALTPDLLSVLLVLPDQMSATSLWQYVQHLRENKQAAGRYEIALWRRVLYPAGIVVMLVLALPFAQQSRRASAGPRVFVGIMLGLAFYFASTLAAHAGWLYEWPPLLAAVLAPLTFLAIAIALIGWLERR